MNTQPFRAPYHEIVHPSKYNQTPLGPPASILVDLHRLARSLGEDGLARQRQQLQTVGAGLLSALQGGDLAGVLPVQIGDGTIHQSGVEDVEEDLSGLQIAVGALDELDGSEQRPDHDEETDDVEGGEVVLPSHLGAQCCSSRGLVHGAVEHERDNHEEAEPEELDDQTDNDDDVADLGEDGNGAGSAHEATSYAECQ